jgi:hypothetical protein
MNRPGWLRSIENGIVRIFGWKLSVGIAQVQSSQPLTDAESIKKAAKILAKSAHIDKKGDVNIGEVEQILKKYNSGALYAESISIIMSKLAKYASEITQNE